MSRIEIGLRPRRFGAKRCLGLPWRLRNRPSLTGQGMQLTSVGNQETRPQGSPETEGYLLAVRDLGGVAPTSS